MELNIDGTKVKLRTSDHMRGNKINLVNSFQIDYHFPQKVFEVRLSENTKIDQRTQRVVLAQVVDPQGQEPPPTDQCYITPRKSLSCVPFVVTKSVGQLSSEGNCMPVLLLNPSVNDIHLNKGMCFTKAELTPMYQRIIFANERAESITTVNCIAETKINAH